MKKWFERLIAPCLVALLVAGAANGAVWQWSKTAATNASVDASINWAEGMSPSSVNDSARAMMARIADWRDDLGGRTLTGGTSSAYTLTTNSGYPAVPNDGTRIAFFMHLTNADNATLAVDGGPARPIVLNTSPTNVPAGVLSSGTTHTVMFCGVCATPSWVLVSVYGQPALVPLGGVIDYVGSTVPNSTFAFANGQCISRTTFAGLFSLIGTTYSVCDGTTTFGLPDLRGRVVAGTNAMGAADSARITAAGGNFDGTTLGTAGGVQNFTLSVAQLPAHTPSGSVTVTATGNISPITPSGSITNTTIAVTDSRTWGTASDVVYFPGAAGTWQSPAAGVSFAAGGRPVTVTGGSISASQSPSFSGSPVTPTFTGTSASGTFSGNNIGSGSSTPQVQPTMVLNKLIRIL